MNLKETLNEFGRKATSPTAFSWYGVVGVAATGVLTFFATKKWIRWMDERREEAVEKAKEEAGWNDIPNEEDVSFDSAKEFLACYDVILKDRPMCEKLKEVAGTVMIFAPPVLAAAGASACIIKGNSMAMKTIGDLRISNNFLTEKLARLKDYAAGAAVNEARHHAPEEVEATGQKLYFSNDQNEVEDYGKKVVFYYDYTEEYFESTIMDVMLAENTLQKLFGLRGYAAVNELRELFGLDIHGWYSECGWDDEIGYRRGYNWIEFAHYRTTLDDGRTCYVIKNLIEPSFAEEFEWIMPEVEDI